MAILKLRVDGEEKELQVYSIKELVKIIQIKQIVIEKLVEENQKLRGCESESKGLAG